MKNFEIQFDRGYGIDKRTGWTVVVDGSVLAELEPWLIVAVFKAIRMMIRIARDRGELDARPVAKCAKCGASRVRIYREYGSTRRTETDMCNGCINERDRPWYVPLVKSALWPNELAYGFTSTPEERMEEFMKLPESSPEKPSWKRTGWESP